MRHRQPAQRLAKMNLQRPKASVRRANRSEHPSEHQVCNMRVRSRAEQPQRRARELVSNYVPDADQCHVSGKVGRLPAKLSRAVDVDLLVQPRPDGLLEREDTREPTDRATTVHIV